MDRMHRESYDETVASIDKCLVDLLEAEVINARGIYTDLGGARISEGVWSAMAEANRTSLELPQLIASAGRIVADALRVPAARVVPGASAGIALSVSACITGGDPSASAALPEFSTARPNVLMQRLHRYKYDRMARLTGAKIVEVGSSQATAISALEEAVARRPSCILFPAHLDGISGSVGLRDVARIAEKAGVPIVVDAAYMVDSIASFGEYLRMGAAFTVFSAKYFYGPGGGGLVIGDILDVEKVVVNDFTGYESGDHLLFGRAFKLDRHTTVGVVAALLQWLKIDQKERSRNFGRLIEMIRHPLSGFVGMDSLLSAVHLSMEEVVTAGPINSLELDVPTLDVRTSLTEALMASPRVLYHDFGSSLLFNVEALSASDARSLGWRLRTALARWADSESSITKK